LVVKPAQEIATLLTSHTVRPALASHPARVRRVSSRRPITGGPTTLPVVRHATRPDGSRWLRVMVPGRPNGSLGWIAQRGTELTTTRWHLVVKTSTRRVLAYRDGHVARSFQAIVGKPSTPTPLGRFFVEESIRLVPDGPGAPYALALSARSTVLQEFEGGPGQIAVHGLANLGGTLGTAISHGCIRLATPSIQWLAARIRPGVPVTITG
jgi:hypothetical protein